LEKKKKNILFCPDFGTLRKNPLSKKDLEKKWKINKKRLREKNQIFFKKDLEKITFLEKKRQWEKMIKWVGIMSDIAEKGDLSAEKWEILTQINLWNSQLKWAETAEKSSGVTKKKWVVSLKIPSEKSCGATEKMSGGLSEKK